MNKRTAVYIKIVLSVVILAVSLRYIMQIYQPTLLDDEFAYFGIAKFFTGRDWSSAISLCRYYSYGYSLVITPFAFFVENTVLLYRLTVGMNGLFLIGSFWLLDSILVQIGNLEQWRETKYSQVIRIFISFFMILLPCNMNYATVALGECLLLFLFLSIVKIIMNLNKNSSIVAYFGLGVLMLYTYMVHQRMLGLVLAGALVFGIRWIKKEMNWKQFLAWVCGLALLFVVHSLIKDVIKEQLWLHGVHSGENDLAGILTNVKQIVSSFAYFGKFIISMLGKLFYLGSSTYLFGFFGLALMLAKVKTLKKKPHGGAAETATETAAEAAEAAAEQPYGVVFVAFSFIIGLGISAVFMNDPDTMSYLLYGRYLETFTPMLMGYGLLRLLAGQSHENTVKTQFYLFLGCGIGYGCLGVLLRFYVKRWNLTWLNYISTGQLYKYLIGDAVPILRIMAVVLATAGMLYFVLMVKKYQNIARLALGIFMAVLFYRTAYIPIHAVNLPLQKERHELSDITSVLKENRNMALEDTERIYYYVTEEEESDTAQYREYVQYWLDRDKLTCAMEADTETWENLGQGALVLVSDLEQEHSEFWELAANMELIYENKICRVYRK